MGAGGVGRGGHKIGSPPSWVRRARVAVRAGYRVQGASAGSPQISPPSWVELGFMSGQSASGGSNSEHQRSLNFQVHSAECRLQVQTLIQICPPFLAVARVHARAECRVQVRELTHLSTRGPSTFSFQVLQSATSGRKQVTTSISDNHGNANCPEVASPCTCTCK